MTFRWTGAEGQVIEKRVRETQSCFEPERRPNLVVQQVKVVSLGAGLDRYGVVVRNDGKTGAGQFNVRLAVGGAVIGLRPVTQLPPGGTVVVHFPAAACTPSEPILAIADPEGQVADYHRVDNTLATACPGA